MRNAFAAEIERLASRNKKIVLLSGDIGNRMFDRFKERFPERFYNCGVAEANMVSVAAGLANSGFRPFVYTINTFLIYRAFEQIKLDLCFQNVPVVLVGVGSGLGYAGLGPTHHSLEDIAVLRSLPNISIYCPCDQLETRDLTRLAVKTNGPVFIRLGKKGEPTVHSTSPGERIKRPLRLRRGRDACILTTGVIVPEVLEAAEILEKNRIEVEVIHFPIVKPFPETTLKRISKRFVYVFSVEEHCVDGGFGSIIAERIAGWRDHSVRFCRMGTPDRFFLRAGSQGFAREKMGLSAAKIAQRILRETK